MSDVIDNELRKLISKMPNISMSGKMAFRELLWQKHENGNLTQADIAWMQTLVGLLEDAMVTYEDALQDESMQQLRKPAFAGDYVGASD